MNFVYLDSIVIPYLSSGFLVVVGNSLLVSSLTVSPRLGRNLFHKAILIGRILYLTVIFELSAMYSPRSAVYGASLFLKALVYWDF